MRSSVRAALPKAPSTIISPAARSRSAPKPSIEAGKIISTRLRGLLEEERQSGRSYPALPAADG